MRVGGERRRAGRSEGGEAADTLASLQEVAYQERPARDLLAEAGWEH